MGVTCITVTGTAILLTTLIMTSEIGLRSLPLLPDEGRRVTLQEFLFRPLAQIR